MKAHAGRAWLGCSEATTLDEIDLPQRPHGHSGKPPYVPDVVRTSYAGTTLCVKALGASRESTRSGLPGVGVCLHLCQERSLAPSGIEVGWAGHRRGRGTRGYAVVPIEVEAATLRDHAPARLSRLGSPDWTNFLTGR
jgi:hypothetical protein